MPLAAGLGAVLLAGGGGVSLADAMPWILLAAALSWGLSQALIWLSVFGSRTTLVAMAWLVSCFTLPFSVGLAPMLTHRGDLRFMALMLLAHLTLLALLIVWRWRALAKSRNDSADVLAWFLCRIHLRPGRIEAVRLGQAGGAAIGVSGAWAGAASVAAYPMLKAWLPESTLVVLAACAGNGLAVWLHAWLVSRWCAQALVLSSIERDRGQRFVSDRFEWLETQRQAFFWGRLLRRCWPAPVTLDAAGTSPPEPKQRKR